jgi:hypothetical protein
MSARGDNVSGEEGNLLTDLPGVVIFILVA